MGETVAGCPRSLHRGEAWPWLLFAPDIFLHQRKSLAWFPWQHSWDLCCEAGKPPLCLGLSHTCWVHTISRALGGGASSWSRRSGGQAGHCKLCCTWGPHPGEVIHAPLPGTAGSSCALDHASWNMGWSQKRISAGRHF